MRTNQASLSPAPVCRALVVDDDKFMQAVLGDMLRELGISQVSTAANGTAGMDVIDRAAGHPDLVLCDLNMPGNDGFQFMEQLAARAFTGSVILVSGMTPRVMKSAALMARFHRLNILGTLGKPVSKADLSTALGAHRAAV